MSQPNPAAPNEATNMEHQGTRDDDPWDDPGYVAAIEAELDGDPDPFEVQVFDISVEREARKLRIRDAARRVVRADTRAATPEPISLDTFLAQPDEEVHYVVDRLMPVGGRVLLAAQFKAGKSTQIGNLIRSLADGDPFLDEYTVALPPGRVVLLDTELDARGLRRWLREQGIKDAARVTVVTLRGKVSSFDITDPAVLSEWVTLLDRLDPSVVILDCLRPVLDACGLDENTEAGRFLVAFDELLDRCGATEAVLVHHMGHNGERARGSSRLLDWPDAIWKLVRQDPEDPASPRFFSAYGRDVDVAECQLSFAPETRHLSIAGGTRKDAKATGTLPAVLDLLGSKDGMSGNQIEIRLLEEGETRANIRAAIQMGIRDGLIRTSHGARNATLHHLSSPVRQSSPPARQRTQSEFASSPYRKANSQEVAEDRDLAKLEASPSGSLHCQRCQRPADELVRGRCRRCSYPAGGSPDDDQGHDAA